MGTVGERKEGGQDSRQGGSGCQGVPSLARKSSLLAATMEKLSAALRCWILTLVRSQLEETWPLQGTGSILQQSEAGGWRRCLQLLERVTQRTQWRSGWRRAPPGRQPTTLHRKETSLGQSQSQGN